MAVTILQYVGSPTSRFFCELSELYARDSIEALADNPRFDCVIAHVGPDGTWRFPAALTDSELAASTPLTVADAVTRLAAIGPDVVLPQMFCHAGMTDYRGLLDVLGLVYLGNRPEAMAITADKQCAKALVAYAGVATPASQSIASDDTLTLNLPVVIKPNAADNSDGITLVRTPEAVPAAIAEAQAHADGRGVLAETYIELGREVRCGVIERDGELIGLPLEEYNVDRESRPVRSHADKLGRADDNRLHLTSKNAESSWIVDRNDPIVPAVWQAAFRTYRALGLRHYGLFDFRIDPDGRLWFLEAGPYCSFAPTSVIATMMQAAGEPLDEFLARALTDWAGMHPN